MSNTILSRGKSCAVFLRLRCSSRSLVRGSLPGIPSPLPTTWTWLNLTEPQPRSAASATTPCISAAFPSWRVQIICGLNPSETRRLIPSRAISKEPSIPRSESCVSPQAPSTLTEIVPNTPDSLIILAAGASSRVPLVSIMIPIRFDARRSTILPKRGCSIGSPPVSLTEPRPRGMASSTAASRISRGR